MGTLSNFTITPDSGWEAASLAAVGALSLFQARAAKKALGDEENGLIKDINDTLANRGDIVNPYANLENPYKNLSVATQAARIQADEADIALANTLDTMRATGKGAGGATALAQAALKSKQGISASIEKQERENEILKAKGQLQVDIAKGKGEMQRAILQEKRTEADLGRLQDKADIAQAQMNMSRRMAMQAFGGVAGALAGGRVFKKLKPPEYQNTNTVDTSLVPEMLESQDPMTQEQRNQISGQVFNENDFNLDGTFTDEYMDLYMEPDDEVPIIQQSYTPGSTALSMFPNKGSMQVVGALNNPINRSAYSLEELDSILKMQTDNPNMSNDDILISLRLK